MYIILHKLVFNFNIYTYCITYLSAFKTNPINPINTVKLIPPADINGIGIPVGGIEPVNTSYCIINLKQKEQINCSFYISFS